MAEIVNPVVEAGVFVGMDPATGIVAGIADDGTVKVLEAWDPVQGDVFHTAPAGSAGGGGTRRHMFDRPIDVTGTGTFSGAITVASAMVNGTLETGRTSGLGVGTRGDLYVDPTARTIYLGRQSATGGDNSIVIWRDRTGTELGRVDTSSGAFTWNYALAIPAAATQGYIALGAVPATAGSIRLTNNTYLRWRNAANSADLAFGIDASNAFVFSGTLGVTTDNAFDMGTLSFRWREIFAAKMTLGGSNPAGVGTLKLPNNNVISWRNAANSADFTIRLGAADTFDFDRPIAVSGGLTSTGVIKETGINGAALRLVAGGAGLGNSNYIAFYKPDDATLRSVFGVLSGGDNVHGIQTQEAADYLRFDVANSQTALTIAATKFATFAGSGSVAGTFKVFGTASGVENDAPRFYLFDTNGTVDQRRFDWTVSTNTLDLEARTDGVGFVRAILSLPHTSGSIQSVGHNPITDNAFDLGASGARWKAGFFSGVVQLGSGSQVMGGGLLKLGTATSNAGAAAQFLGWSGGNVNWQIDTAYIATGLNFTPSTAAGGSTFTTPAMTLSGAGVLVLNAGRINSNDAGSGLGSAFQLFVGGANQGGLYNYSVVSGTGTDYTPTLFSGAGLGVRVATNGSATTRMTVSTAGTVQTVVDLAATQAFEAWNKDTAGNNLFMLFFTEGGSGSLRGSIDYNRGGGVTRYNTTSDGTLKTILGDADPAESLAILRGTRLRSFYWNDDETRKPQIGPIAQELASVFKGAVSIGGSFDRSIDTDDGPETVSEYQPWSVDKTAFAWHVVAGWQDHDRRIADLEREVLELRARLEPVA